MLDWGAADSHRKDEVAPASRSAGSRTSRRERNDRPQEDVEASQSSSLLPPARYPPNPTGDGRYSGTAAADSDSQWRAIHHNYSSTGNLQDGPIRPRGPPPSSRPHASMVRLPRRDSDVPSTRSSVAHVGPFTKKGSSADRRGGARGARRDEKRTPPTPRLATAATAPRSFSRRKAPIAPAIRYLMEAMCTDLIACGECYVPDDKAGQTLIRFCGFVPIEIDEAIDTETTRFMNGHPAEAYGRGVGLPGMAWTSSQATVVEISAWTDDPSFDTGGKRLKQAGRLFRSALVVPLYSNTDGIFGGRELMGVVVVYFADSESARTSRTLKAYASSVADSASKVSELMVHRAQFVERRADRVNRNWRIMRIALKFMMPMWIRYKKMTGKLAVDGADVEGLEAGVPTVVTTVGDTGLPMAFRAPRHKLVIHKSKRPAIQVPPGAKAVLSSREAIKRMPKDDGTKRGFSEWLSQYLAKAKGGPVHMQEPINPRDSFVTWMGVFSTIAVLELALNIMNGSFPSYRGEDDLFVLSGSFGALCTLLYAVPAVPLAQPRVILSAHTLAIAASMVTIYLSDAGDMVWLQKSITVASVITGMSLMGTVHPPAGALVLVFLGAFNKGASMERIYTLIASVVIGLVVHVLVGIWMNNLSPRRQYPLFW